MVWFGLLGALGSRRLRKKGESFYLGGGYSLAGLCGALRIVAVVFFPVKFPFGHQLVLVSFYGFDFTIGIIIIFPRQADKDLCFVWY